MSTNTFSALSALNGSKQTSSSVKIPVPVTKFTFGNGQSTSAWGDDESDDEPPVYVNEAQHDEEEEEEEDESESEESESEEEEEPTEVKSISHQATASVEKKHPERTLSKKEKKRLEMDELEAALAELGVPAHQEVCKDVEAAPSATPNEQSESTSKKSKKKKKKTKSKSDDGEPEKVDSAPIADIRQVLKSKVAKKKSPSEAVQLAQAEAKKKSGNKKKKNRDKATFNQAPTK